MKHILDTNVLVVANGDNSPQASDICIQQCAKLLLQILKGENDQIIIDTARLIIGEYHKNINLKKSLAGSQFLLAILKNPKLCCEVILTPQDDNTFLEFPNDDHRLAEFDPADRKWIASARAHLTTYPTEPAPPIAQATDTKWHDFEEIFKEHGVIINWLCE